MRGTPEACVLVDKVRRRPRTAVQRNLSLRSIAAGAGALDGGRRWTAHGRHLRDAIIEGTEHTAAAAAALWQSEGMRRLLRTWYVRLTAAAALALGLATAVINLWAVRSINASLLPQVSAAASRALDRDVSARLLTCCGCQLPDQGCYNLHLSSSTSKSDP